MQQPHPNFPNPGLNRAWRGQLMTSARVSAGARLHLGLLDMAGFSARKYGGIGCNLEEPRVKVIAHATSGATGIHSREPVASALLHRVRTVVDRFLDERKAGLGQLEIVSAFQGHAGLGLGTSLTLASLKAAALARHITVTDTELILASGRGGTSGVGCNGFFSGGWTIDAGQPQDWTVHTVERLQRAPTVPKTCACGSTSWDVALFFRKESNFQVTLSCNFRDATPVPKSDVACAFPTLYHGLLPALLENDVAGFGQNLDVWNRLGFKKREIDAQSTAVQRTLSALRGYAPAVGMSSLGPTVFAFTEMGTDWSDASRRLGMRALVTRVTSRGWSTF